MVRDTIGRGCFNRQPTKMFDEFSVRNRNIVDYFFGTLKKEKKRLKIIFVIFMIFCLIENYFRTRIKTIFLLDQIYFSSPIVLFYFTRKMILSYTRQSMTVFLNNCLKMINRHRFLHWVQRIR